MSNRELAVPKEKCMKITFPKDEKILEMFKGLPPIFVFEESERNMTVYCPIGYEIRRDIHNLTPLQFRRVYNKLKVEGGRKLWRGHCLILDPAKKTRIRIRLSRSELALMKIAASLAGESLSDYIRAAVFTRMARELGL
jgi:hypothetical protein